MESKNALCKKIQEKSKFYPHLWSGRPNFPHFLKDFILFFRINATLMTSKVSHKLNENDKTSLLPKVVLPNFKLKSFPPVAREKKETGVNVFLKRDSRQRGPPSQPHVCPVSHSGLVALNSGVLNIFIGYFF